MTGADAFAADLVLGALLFLAVALFILGTCGAAVWLFYRIAILLREGGTMRRKRKTDLVPEAEVAQTKYVVWGRRETGKRVGPWEPYYVGDDPNQLLNEARGRYSTGYGLILLENGVDPGE